MVATRPPRPTHEPLLYDGQRLTRDEFVRRYEDRPDLKKAELLEGVVHMPSPVGYYSHARPQGTLAMVLTLYSSYTPGMEAGVDPSLRLDESNEPQPDVVLFIQPDHGGQSRFDERGFFVRAPELVAEVSASTQARDRGPKKRLYQRFGVREYVNWLVEDKTVEWWALREDRYYPLLPDEGGMIRSEVFPGLWLDVNALIRHDLVRLREILARGVRSFEHAAFVDDLLRAARRNTP